MEEHNANTPLNVSDADEEEDSDVKESEEEREESDSGYSRDFGDDSKESEHEDYQNSRWSEKVTISTSDTESDRQFLASKDET